MSLHFPVPIRKALPVLILSISVATPAWSQVETTFTKGFAREGGFIGVSGVRDFTFDGVTFDGATVYREEHGEELAMLPRLDRRNMMRALLGVRGRQAALEFSYERSKHNGSFAEFPVDTTFQAVNVDGRFFFLTDRRIQPHALVGGAFPWLNIKDGSFLEPDLGNATWKGYGLNTEAGVTVYPHPRLGIGLGYAYRVMWFDRMTGVSDRLFHLRPRFRETSGSMVLTGALTF